MIVRDDVLQCLRCTVCGQTTAPLRKDWRDQQRLLELQEEMQLDHAIGAASNTQPAECKYRRGMREQMQPEEPAKVWRRRAA